MGTTIRLGALEIIHVCQILLNPLYSRLYSNTTLRQDLADPELHLVGGALPHDIEKQSLAHILLLVVPHPKSQSPLLPRLTSDLDNLQKINKNQKMRYVHLSG